MTVWIALILGIVQGLTEFLPVSSSGHLTLLNKIFGINGDTLLLTILLHIATLFAVFFVLRKEIFELIKKPFSIEAKNLYIATIPTVLIVILTKNFLEDSFASAKLLPYCFLITAILLTVTNIIDEKNKKKNYYYPEKGFRKNVFSSITMGIAQGLAVLPGISRSGATICAGLIAGENREKTAKFSFLMSIPIIIASMIYELWKGDFGIVNGQGMLRFVVISFISAFVVGILAIKLMLKVVQKAKYYWFSFYLVIIAIVSFFFV